MTTSLVSDIHTSVARVVAGDMTIRGFEDWFVPATWDIERSDDDEAVRLAHWLLHQMTEYDSGLWNDEDDSFTDYHDSVRAGRSPQRKGRTMTTHGTGTFEGKSWDEQPISDVDGAPKLTHALVTNAYQGAIDGEGTLEYLLMYRHDGTCLFVGAERIVGTVDGRSGSFVLQHNGVFAQETATTTLAVVAGCGTGDLATLRGEGFFAAGHGTVPYTFDYHFE
jgi:uncharacterized protein DUF3224